MPPTGAHRGVLAAAAAVVVAGVIGAAVLPAPPAPRAAGGPGPQAPTTLPGRERCPTGGLVWSVTGFTVKPDPLNPHDATVTENGSVRNDTGAYVTLTLPEATPDVVPVPGAAPPYPLYLQLVTSDLYPGESSPWQGSSSEVGAQHVGEGRVTYQAAWDSPALAVCPPAAHLGAP